MAEGGVQVEGLSLDLELIGELGRRAAQDQALRSAVLGALPADPSEALVARLSGVQQSGVRVLVSVSLKWATATR